LVAGKPVARVQSLLTNEVAIMAKYGKKAQDKVEKVMHEYKEGTLKSGGSGRKVSNRKQAIAIGLSEARASGAKVPDRKSSKKSSRPSASRGKKSSRKSASKKSR
jgi:hypothetical protein